uniref:RNA-dependent RNA polymerase n=1 Tax=Echinostoma caproni TaxID=27848 RepID=A0A183A518_9TREM
LNALNGGVVRLRPAIHFVQRLLDASDVGDRVDSVKSKLLSRLHKFQIRYLEKSGTHTKGDNSFYCNTDGFLAYRCKDMAVEILLHLANNMSVE